MARKINKAPVFNPRKHSLRMWNEAIAAGTASPEQAGIAYSGAPMFRKMAGRLARTGAPDMPTAPQLSAQFWGATPTPVQRATDEQAIAEAELGAGTARAEMPWLEKHTEQRFRGIKQPLDIEQQRAEQETALHAPTLEELNIANQLAKDELAQKKAMFPILQKQAEVGGPPLHERDYLQAAPPEISGAIATQKLAPEMGGAVGNIRRQQAMSYAGSIMSASGLADMMGYSITPDGGRTYSPETDMLQKIVGDIGAPNPLTINILSNFVNAVRNALNQSDDETAGIIKAEVRNRLMPIEAEWMQPTIKKRLVAWPMLSMSKNYKEVKSLIRELQELVR